MLTEKGFKKRKMKILLKEGLYKEDKQSSRQNQKKSSSVDHDSNNVEQLRKADKGLFTLLNNTTF